MKAVSLSRDISIKEWLGRRKDSKTCCYTLLTIPLSSVAGLNYSCERHKILFFDNIMRQKYFAFLCIM